MTSTHDGVSDGHGPLFVGLYLNLLVRYLRLDRAVLLDSPIELSVESLHLIHSAQVAAPVLVDPVGDLQRAFGQL